MPKFEVQISDKIWQRFLKDHPELTENLAPHGGQTEAAALVEIVIARAMTRRNNATDNSSTDLALAVGHFKVSQIEAFPREASNP